MSTKTRKIRADKGVKKALKKIAPEDVKEILESVLEEEDKRIEIVDKQPGTKVNGQKIAWTYEEMKKRFAPVTFISEMTERITWNGVVFQLYVGAEHTVPEPIRNEYFRIRREARGAGKLGSSDIPTGITHYPGAGTIDWGKE